MTVSTEAGTGTETAEIAALSLREWLQRSNLGDILTSRGHSQDFNGSRAEYIYLRLRLLSFFFAVMAPLWIPLDYAFLNNDRFYPLLWLRIGFSGMFLALALWRTVPHSLPLARLRLGFFVLIPALFYIGSRFVLDEGMPDQGVLIGYSFLPFLMIAFLAIFPLTLCEGMLYAGVTLLVMVFSEQAVGGLFTVAGLGKVWLLLLLAGIATWAELAQLHMLLRLYREATRDSLTGLVNRRVFGKWLGLEIKRARTEGTPMSVLLFDLDLFKRINDTHGHLAGDRVLQAFASVLNREIGDEALLGRYGGEEFLAILPGRDVESARTYGERVRSACHRTVVKGPDGNLIPFTVSVGVSQLHPDEIPEALIRRVDGGLYAAKEAGRDLVVVAE